MITDLVKYFGGQAIVIGINIINSNNIYKIYEKNNHKDLIEHIIEIQNLELAKLKLIL